MNFDIFSVNNILLFRGCNDKKATSRQEDRFAEHRKRLCFKGVRREHGIFIVHYTNNYLKVGPIPKSRLNCECRS